MGVSLLHHRQAELPTPKSTLSYWHRDPSEKLLGHRTTEDLPSTADVVVIGSGITGTFAVQELVVGGREVIMLEARETCWGATGRNGGHCEPAVWDSSPEIARFELATFNTINALVAEHNIPCDWQVVGGVHAIYLPEAIAAARKQIKRLQRHPDLKDKASLIFDKAELAAHRVPGAIAAVYQPHAAKCWPYKLVAWLLERLLREHDAAAFNLQTNTPVERLQRCGSSWVVHTSRGRISAQVVLLASNAYTSYLLPKMTELIVPVRGQVCALEPPPNATQLPNTYGWVASAGHQYLIPRGPEDTQVENGGVESRATDRSLIFGGERLAVPGEEEGISRDDTIHPVISQRLHSGLNGVVELIPGGESEPKALRAAYEWTGIMGYSIDGSPWVGSVPGTLADSAEGLWISAGYTGHGMPVAARCGVAVAQMVLGKDGGLQVPEQWIASDERVERARGLELPRTVDEMIESLPVEF